MLIILVSTVKCKANVLYGSPGNNKDLLFPQNNKTKSKKIIQGRKIMKLRFVYFLNSYIPKIYSIFKLSFEY